MNEAEQGENSRNGPLTRALVPQMKDPKCVIHISSIDPKAQRFSGRNINCKHHRQSNQR